MQTTGMLLGTRAIYFLVLFAPLVDHTHSYPYQVLPSIPGYIPVYIRNGDQPLEEINPGLAEAFHEHSGLSKSIRLDRNFGQLESIEESRANSLVNESRKKYYPAYARESGNSIASNERREEEDKHAEKNPGRQVPKLVSLYELHEKLKKTQKDNRFKDGSDIRASLAKVSSILSTEKKDNSDKPSTEIEKDEIKPNDLYDPNPNYPELPAEIGHNRDTPQDFVSVIGLESLTEQPNVRQYKDLSHLTEEKNAVDDKNKKKEVEPVKEQRPSDILSNVQKLSPIAPPEAYGSQKSDEKIENKTEIKTSVISTQKPTHLLYKDLSHISKDIKVIESFNEKDDKSVKEDETSSDDVKDTVVKEIAKEENPTNVFKLSPIAPPEAYETEEEKKSTKIKVEEKKPIDTSIVHLPINQPIVHLYKDLSHISNDEEETATEKENDTPIKLESPYKIPTNVFKLSPIAPPEAYSKMDDQEAVPSSILVREIIQENKKIDLTGSNDDVTA